MAKTWSSFLPYVQPYLPGCPEIVITSHLQEAAADFLAQSEIWRYTIEQDFTSKATSDYEIDVPQNTVIENIFSLYVDECKLRPVTDRHFDRPSTTPTARPTRYSIYQDTQVSCTRRVGAGRSVQVLLVTLG